MSTTVSHPSSLDHDEVAADIGGLGADLARASLALARRFSAGATMWCVAPEWPSHAHHVAVEFVHPVIMGKRALPAVALGAGTDLVDTLRASARSGDILVAVGGEHRSLFEALRRSVAWGVETVWIGAGPRPAAGVADHVLWLGTDDPLEACERFVRVYHLLWELTHVCFEHSGLLKPDECADEVCITCSDQGVLAEVVSVAGDEARVRTADGSVIVDVSLVVGPRPGDLLLVHAGSAITLLDRQAS